MGIGNTDINAVIRLRERGLFEDKPKIVEIGAQQMSAQMFRDKSWIDRIAKAFGVPRRDFTGPDEQVLVHGRTEGLDPQAPSAKDLWEWLGFHYTAIDVDGSPGSVPLDLNYDATPPALHGQADLVTNCGTTEHIANQLNAFKVIHELTAVGGVMLHNLPAQGYLNHGLVNYNPKFFWSLSAANAYNWSFFDYQQVIDAPYALPQNIRDQMSRFQDGVDGRCAGYSFADAGILVVMQKAYDLPFVAPIDVPPGSDTHNAELKRRYWSVFDSDTFQDRLKQMRW
jgi:hypothetical protein